MKKMTWVILAVLLVGIVSASWVIAYGSGKATKQTASEQGNGPRSVDLASILASGTYQDIVDYRASSGVDVMPWVQSEADFELAKEVHAKKAASGLASGGFGQGRGRSGGACPHASGGCPFAGQGAGSCPMLRDADDQ